jgi:hypothetical protein
MTIVVVAIAEVTVEVATVVTIAITVAAIAGTIAEVSVGKTATRTNWISNS